MWRWAACLIALSIVVEPLTCAAEDDDGPSIVGYGLSGFGTGVGLGLASGFLATGHTFESGEWKALVLGTAVGALSGMGVGIALGIVDASATPPRRGVGNYILQDIGYGVTLGALSGAVVGVIVWVTDEDGRPKDVLFGLAYGIIIGASVGAVLGIVQGALYKPPAAAEPAKLSFNLGFTPSSSGLPLPYPSLLARF